MNSSELSLLTLSDRVVSLLNKPKSLGIISYCEELEQTHKEILSLIPQMPSSSEYSEFILNLSTLLRDEISSLRERIRNINDKLEIIKDQKKYSNPILPPQLSSCSILTPPASPQFLKSKLTKKHFEPQTPVLPIKTAKITPENNIKSVTPSLTEKDFLTLELLQMTHRLKSQNLNLQKLVLEDEKNLLSVHKKMGTTATSFQKEQKNLAEYSSKSLFTTWRLFLIVIGCLLSFIICFLIIIVS